MCHLSPPAKFTVAGTAPCPTSRGCVGHQPGIAEVPHLGLMWNPQLRSWPGPALVQAPTKPTASGHPLTGCPSGLSRNSCAFHRTSGRWKQTRWCLLPRWDLQACPGGAHALGAQGGGADVWMKRLERALTAGVTSVVGRACPWLLSCSILLPLQGVSKQPAPVLSPGLSSNPVSQQMHVSWAHRAVAWTSVLPVSTHQALL